MNPRRLRTFEYLLKARFTRALAQSENPNPGRMKRKYIGSKNIALPLHRKDVVRGGGGPQHSAAPVSGPHRAARSEEPCPLDRGGEQRSQQHDSDYRDGPPALAAGWSPR